MIVTFFIFKIRFGCFLASKPPVFMISKLLLFGYSTHQHLQSNLCLNTKSSLRYRIYIQFFSVTCRYAQSSRRIAILTTAGKISDWFI